MTLVEEQSLKDLKQAWVQQWYMKSKSENSKSGALKALKWFEDFITIKFFQKSEIEVIQDLKLVANDPNKNSQLYLFLNNFVQYLQEKNKAPRTIQIYTMFIKSYLRQHGIKIYKEDMQQFVHFPKQLRERKQPLTRDIIAKLLEFCEPKYKAIILMCIATGARIGEVLQATPSDIDQSSNPVRFRIRASTTKTREERETYLTAEAFKAVKPFLDKNTRFIFIDDWTPDTVVHVESVFKNIRKSAGLLTKYDNGMYHVNIHAFRAYAFTRLAQKCGENYAHALLGHHAYLDQYFRETPEERAAKYRLVEPELTIGKN